MVEQAQSTAIEDVRAVAAMIELAAPEGQIRVDGKTQHLYKTARIGRVRSDGLIEEVFASAGPLKPDPYLEQYPWAAAVRKFVEENAQRAAEQ